jgi:hypothetical protein
MSPVGTFRTWRDVRLESVMRTKADVLPTPLVLWVHALGHRIHHAAIVANVIRSLAVAQPLRGKVKPRMRLRLSVALLSSINDRQYCLRCIPGDC